MGAGVRDWVKTYVRDVVLNRRVLESSNSDSIWGEVGVGTVARAYMHICRKIKKKRCCRRVILLLQPQ